MTAAPISPQGSTPVLEARAVSVSRGRRQALHAVSLALRPGELWALVGPNGSGKSTLLGALVGSLRLSCGTVLLEGRAVERISLRDRARVVALVGREVGHDLPLTVRAVVEMGRLPHGSPLGPRRRVDVQVVERALLDAGCSDLADRLILSLSDGERQRVHFARALAQRPRVLLMDEATAHVDLARREEMLGRVATFTHEGGAALFVLHDLDVVVRRCSRVAVLEAGCLRAAGSPRALFDRALLANVFGVDATVVEDEKGPNLRVYGVARARRTTRS